MNEPVNTPDSLAAEERRHQLCREFEAELKAGATPYIEAYLHKVPEAEQAELFRELLALELAYARDTPPLDEYLLRFPRYEELTKAIFAEVQSRADSRRGDSPRDGLPSTVSEAGQAPARKVRPTSLPSIPDYELLDELGRGGMAVVYRARHLKLDRIVALKMIRGGEFAGDEEKKEFEAEAQAVARFQHPNIVPIYEIGEHGDQPYFTQQLLEGGSLAARLKGEPQPPRQAAQMIETLARAMHYAHERRIIHRDLKPANVLLAADGTPKVADFGLAKSLPEDAGQAETQRICGTPSYMAPEQAAHDVRLIGPATDVYALGAILYEMLTGRPPFKGANKWETLEQVRTEEPVPPTRLQPKVPRDLETICLKCLEKERRKRYASGAELAEDVRRFLNDQPIQARPVTRRERLVKWARREPKVAALIGLVVVVFALGFGGVVYQLQETRDALAALQETENAKETALNTAIIEKKRADGQKERAEREKDVAEFRAHHLRHSLYSSQLMAISSEWERDPGRALRMLEDEERCPGDLREFTWGFFHRLCKRNRRGWKAHEGQVRFVGFCSDGRTVVTGGEDGAVRLWDIASGKEKRMLCGRGPCVSCGQLTADGSVLAVVFDGGSIKQWQLPSGELLGSWIDGAGAANAVAYSPDGKLVATGGMRKMVQIWDTKTGELQKRFGPLEESVYSLAFSRMGTRIAAGTGAAGASGPAQVHVWEVSNGKELFRMSKLRYSIRALAFLGDEDTLVVADGLGQLIRASLTSRSAQLVHSHGGTVFAIAMSSDWRRFATAAVEGDAQGGIHRAHQPVLIWNSTTLQKESYPLGLEGTATAVAFGPTGNMLATGSENGTVAVWQTGSQGAEAVLAHSQPVGHVQFTPDARTIISHSGEGTRLWELSTGSVVTKKNEGTTIFAQDGANYVTVQKGHIRLCDSKTDQCRATFLGEMARFSPDSRVLATSSSESIIELRDRVTGNVLGEFSGDELAFSPDGRILAAATDDQHVDLWDTAAKKKIATISHPGPGNLRAIQFTPDGRDVVARIGQKQISVWDAASGKLRRSFSTEHPIGCLALSPSGKYLATGEETDAWGRAAPIRVWALHEEGASAILPGHQGRVYSLAFSSDGKRLASVGDDGLIRWFNIATGSEEGSLRGPSKKNYQVLFGPDGKSLLTCGDNKEVLWWDIATRRERTRLKGVEGVVLSPDGKTLAGASENKDVILWDLQTGNSQVMAGVRFRARHSLFGMAFAPDSLTLAVTGNGHDIALCDVRTGKSQRVVQGGMLRFAPVGAVIGVTLRRERVSLWDMPTGKAIGTLSGHEPMFSPDGSMLATTSAATSVAVWNARTLVPLVRLPGHPEYVRDVLFAPGGHTMVTIDGEQSIRLWDPSTGKLLFRMAADLERVLAVVFSPDGEMLALGGSPKTRDDPADILLIDLNLKKGQQRRLKGHTGDVYALAFSPDGKTLASGSFDFSVKLWDPVTGQELTTLSGHKSTVFSVCFSPTGNLLATASYDRTVRLWASNVDRPPIVPWALVPGMGVDAQE